MKYGKHLTEVKLDILASDVRKVGYGNAKDCPITRAFARAGYPHLVSVGSTMKRVNTRNGVYEFPTYLYSDDYDSQEYLKMDDWVIGMYATKHEDEDDNPYYGHNDLKPIEDISFTIQLPTDFIHPESVTA